MQGEGPGLGERQGVVVPRPGLLQGLDLPANVPRDLAVAAASHPIGGIALDASVPHVRTGTPVRPTKTGWVICDPDEAPVAYAGNSHSGGESFVAYRAITAESYKRQFWPGEHYNISQIDDTGRVTFVEQSAGPYVALSESQIVLDVRLWRPPPIPARPPEAQPPEPEPEMPQLAAVQEEHKPDDEFEMPGDDDDAEEGDEDEEGEEGRS